MTCKKPTEPEAIIDPIVSQNHRPQHKHHNNFTTHHSLNHKLSAIST